MAQSTQRSAIGQNFPLGTFYNARNDRFMSTNLFKANPPAEAIERTDIHAWNVRAGYDEAYERQFEVMGISTELGASILAGLVPLKGSSVYLNERPRSRNLQAAVHHTITTVTEALRFGFPGLADCLMFNNISSGEVSHIVCKIEWGVRSIIGVRQYLDNGTRSDAAKNDFKSDFNSFLSVIDSSKQAQNLAANVTSLRQTQLSPEITAYSDVLEDNGIIMENFQEAYEFLQIMPLHVKDHNEGKGMPIAYSLLPIAMLNYILPAVRTSEIGNFFPPAQDCLNSIIQLFNEIHTCQRTLYDLERNVQANGRYLPHNILSEIEDRQRGLEAVQKTIRIDIARAIQEVRGGSDPGILWQALAQYQQGHASPRNLANIGTAFRKTIEFISRAVSKGAFYVGHNGTTLHSYLPRQPDSEAYVLFFTPTAMGNDEYWESNHDLLLELLQTKGPKTSVIILDCEAISINLERVHIAHHQGGQLITSEYLEHKLFMADKCFAECDPKTVETGVRKPIQRRHVTIPCPGSQCSKAEAQWICPLCVASIEYGFSDQYIYCDCGRSLFTNYKFKCSGNAHGPQYVSYEKDRLLLLLQGLSPANYLNVLILGETGVGKSTFINALVNYLEFETLDDAISVEDLNYVIPCSFSTQIMDRTGSTQSIQVKKVQIGSREDERDGSKGDSATQQTTVYPVTFNMGDSILTVRLIDTPGMGDTRGVDTDRQNMADVLSTLSSYEELHGILVLLKSNASRLTITFRYCVEELLTHLHQKAARNIAFGFTNTRISNYTPGDTYEPLNKLLHERPGLGLNLSMSTTYCFDSESFRYLAAVKKGVKMPNKADFDSSWRHSRGESIRLINQFRKNPPHEIKSTLSLNGARQLISELTKPIAEMSQIINGSIAMTEDKMQEIKDTRLSGDQLRGRLHVQKVQMSTRTLDQPRTVCANGDCIEARDDGKDSGKTVTLYKKHCHPVCHLDDVQVEQIAHPNLINCAAFSGSDTCNQCGHIWKEHLHVLYELEPETVTVIDPSIQQKIQANANDITLRQTALKQHEQRIHEYEQERETIRTAAAKFAVFLSNNSLAAYNNALIDYLDYLIKEEQIKVQAGGSDTRLLSLTDERQKHKEAIQLIDANKHSKANNIDLSEGGVDKIVTQLYGLKHFGTTLKNMKQGIVSAHEATYREIPHTVKRKTVRKQPLGSSARHPQGRGLPSVPQGGQGQHLGRATSRVSTQTRLGPMPQNSLSSSFASVMRRVGL
ncbi:hypothetical protein EV356DRAFT_533617 [Viridothelium virens]|uniref:Uncharacterized protein n=1 Tax=Viridothelium virens TaxID=1048519 RepID=A0A6A6H692_VIRVR|nr:hypothetical protein EV356DRAFT_533617 [Viridothelium virens]